MGIYGLKRYATSAKHLRECSDFLPQLSDITLAVDFNGFLYFVCEQLCQQVQQQQPAVKANANGKAVDGVATTSSAAAASPLTSGCWRWLLLGGCTLRLEQFVTNWLNQLRAHRVQLVFVQDPPTCFGGKDHRKGSCHVQRAASRVANVEELLEVSCGDHDQPVEPTMSKWASETTTELLKKTNLLFPLAREALQTLLRKHKIPLTTSKREADEDLAQLVRSDQAFAVLADDSDFLCMRGIRYIPFEWLKVQPNNQTLSARVFSPERVAKSLDISEDQLIDLVLLCSNDLTQGLDEKYQLAEQLDFPDQRQKANAVLLPERAAEWIRNNMPEGFSVLDNPVLLEIEQSNHGFLASLYEIYRFYGYSSQFIAKYHIKAIKPLTKKAYARYLELLDVKCYPQYAIDLLETQSRRLGVRFDVLALDCSKRMSMEKLTKPLRAICYHLLNVDFVEEIKYDWNRKQHIVEHVHAVKWDLLAEKSKPRNSNIKSKHLLSRVDDLQKGLVQMFLFGSPRHQAAVSFCSMGKTPEDRAIGIALNSVMLLWKCDCLLSASESDESMLLNDFWMDVLLITSVLSLKRTSCDDSFHLVNSDTSNIDWRMCGVANGFLEVMALLKQMRVFLGDTDSQCDWLHVFSADVFAAVVALVKTFRRKNGTEAQPLGLSKREVKLIFERFQHELSSTEVEGTTWRLFWNTSSSRKALQKLAVELSRARSEDSGDADASSPDEDRDVNKLGGEFVCPAVIETLELDDTVMDMEPALPSSHKKKKKKKKAKKKLKEKQNKEVHLSTGMHQPNTSVVDQVEAPMAIPPSPLPSELPIPPFLASLGTRTPPLRQTPSDAPTLTPPIVMKLLGNRVKQPRPLPRSFQRSQLHGGNKAAMEERQTIAGRVKEPSPTPFMNGHFSGSDSITTTTDGLQSDELHHVSSRKATQQRVKLHQLMNTLPVYQHREEILDTLKNDQLVVIQGETGCGKSTSVPQFILDDYFENGNHSDDHPRPSIYVTQPRRVAAIELASTVAKMRKDKDAQRGNALGETIGYRIGQKQMTSRKTCITYVTTGYMVERLVHEPDSLRQLTHLVLDEVHERSMDVDLLLLLIRLLLAQHPHVKLIIMSATMDAKVILKYFQKSLPIPLTRKKALFVGSKLFPVRQVFLDQLTQFFPRLHQESKDLQHLCGLYDKLMEMGASVAKASGALTKRIANIYTDQLQLIVRMTCFLIDTFVIAHQHANSNGDDAIDQPTHYVHKPSILIFLPGITGIQQLHEEFSALQRTSYHDRRIKLFVLHSDLEIEHQQSAFESIDDLPDYMAKVILSTNIAESSVTIPDVTHVINCGLEKQIVMPDSEESHTEVLVNEWCSRASTQQRSGRAGRVMPGMAFHLFPQRFHEEFMREYTVPELLRTPLDRVLLILKAKLTTFGVPSELLQMAMDQPDQSNIDGAYKLLYELDAIETEKESSEITMFGRFACQLPLDLHLSRLILNSLWFSKTRSVESRGLVTDMVILVSILAVPDLFRMPSRFHTTSAFDFMEEMKANLRSKLVVDKGMWSEPMAMWRHYKEFIVEHENGNKPSVGAWVRQFMLSFRRYQTLNYMVSELCGRLRALSRQAEFRELCWSEDEMTVLQSLDTYASSGRADDTLVQFAKREDAAAEGFVRVLLVHNYSENMISSILVKSKKKSGAKSLQKAEVDKSRVWLRLSDENAVEFGALQQEEKRQLFGLCCLDSAKELVQMDRPSSDQISLTFARVESTESLTTKDPSQIALRSACFPVSLLYYIRDQRFPIDFAVDNNEMTSTFRVRLQACDVDDQVLSWRLQRNGCKVSIRSRNLLTLPFRTEFVVSNADEEIPSKVYGVFTDRLYTGDETRMYCGKCTLLPLDSTVFYPLVLLLCARSKANIWVFGCADGSISALKVNGQNFAFSGSKGLDWKVLSLVNLLRLEFSLALLGKQTNQAMMMAQSVASIDKLMTMFQDSNALRKLSKEQSKSLSWLRLEYVEEDVEIFRYPRFEL